MVEKRQLVVVTWDDAWQDQENFASVHGIRATHAPMKVETLGYLIQDDDVGISVANEHSVQDGSDVFRGRTFVPRAMVRKMVPYGLTRTRTKRRVEPVETPDSERIVGEIQTT